MIKSFKIWWSSLHAHKEGAPHFRVGMRMVKTSLSVFVCTVIGWLRDSDPFYAMLAALMCMENSIDGTLTKSFDRILGTIVGGFYGIVLILLKVRVCLPSTGLLYYFITSVTLIPIIITVTALRRPDCAKFSCAMFLVLTVRHIDDSDVLVYTINRLLDTLIGIVVTFAINISAFSPPRKQDRPPTGVDGP